MWLLFEVLPASFGPWVAFSARHGHAGPLCRTQEEGRSISRRLKGLQRLHAATVSHACLGEDVETRSWSVLAIGARSEQGGEGQMAQGGVFGTAEAPGLCEVLHLLASWTVSWLV